MEGRLHGGGKRGERREGEGEGEEESLSATECLPPCGIEARTHSPTLYPCLFLGSKQGGPRPLLVLVLVLVFVHIAISLPSSSSSSSAPLLSPRLRFPPLSGSLLSRPLHGAQTSVYIHSASTRTKTPRGRNSLFPSQIRR